MKTSWKKKCERIAVLAVAGGVLLNSVPAVSSMKVQAKETKQTSEGITQKKIDAANNAYNDAETKIEFLTMSDTEFGGKPEDISDTQKVSYEAQNYLYQRIRKWADEKNFQIDAIMDNGDVVGGNDPGSEKDYAKGWYAAVDQVFTENFGDYEPVVMLASGNHDFADVMGDVFDINHREDGQWFYGNSETNYVGNLHTKVNGYDFITLDYNGESTFGYGGQQSGYQDFLKKTLEEITSASDYDPTKPIFVQAHSGYQGTTLGGQWAGVYDTMGMDVQNILADYPQAMLFSAHTHFPVEEESAIYQKNFTVVENGSMNYIYKDVPGDFIEGGYLDTGNLEIPEKTCNFISVLEDGTTVIRRFDVSNERWIGMPWIIDTTNGKEGFRYTDDQRSKIAPWFEETAQIHTSNVTETGLTFGFDHAQDDQLVNHYEVSVKDSFTNQFAAMKVKQIPVKGEPAQKSVNGTFRSLSRYYYRPNTMLFEFEGLEPGRIYSVEIYAVDDFGNRSEKPLTGTFRTAGELSFPEIDGGTVLPDDIENGKFFEMNFEGSLTDEIGQKDAAAHGNVDYTESYRSDFGKAVTIGGSGNDYVDLGNREEWNLGVDKDLTINFWTKVNSCNGYGSILSNKNWTNWYRKGINIAPEGSNTEKIEFTLGDDANGVYATGQVPQYKGSWHMMTFTIDRTNQVARTYMDGVLYKETSIAEIGDMTSNLNMLLGVDGGGAYGNIGFDMDELEMWNRPLSEEDIQTYYNVTGDSSALVQEAIFYAEYLLQKIEDNEDEQIYDEVLTQNLKDAVENAKQSTVDNMLQAYLELKECVEKVENQPVHRELSTAVLEYALELAKDVETEDVIDSVKARFEEAYKNANDIYTKVQNGDTTVTQTMIDDAWKELIKSMQYLSFKKADKADLEKVIVLAKTMEENIDAYLDEGKEEFTKALDEARKVLDDGDAMQEEVTAAWKNLMTAMADMQLKPDKNALENLVAQAEGFAEHDYEAESFAVMRTALASAREVLADENATQETVDASMAELEGAIAKLTPVKGETVANAGAQPAAGNEEKATITSTSANNTTSNTQKSVKTGDETTALPFAAGAAIALAAFAAFRRKRG
ncbi:LamG-like jellyroll fold domain-containing protein [Lachnoclostridium sp. An181]|uniref:LamG-like jellyroll fold domain-containing protein n=1 Tax=Lachnoclostridium sp. An181 TaxID=1965575 RepID=UPI0013A64B8C|nr:LamG-like jellyroll fold domain-containing protein [Lachnoclostridium sp. An181]